MRRKEIRLALVYRDMWQSAGKYVPRVDQLVRVAPAIVDIGCFDRVETNGGGFEQVNLLFGENPNKSVRQWTQAFNDAGIQTQMLERGLNAISMGPMPKDVRKLMFKVKKKQGTDISRSFDGLNNPQNLALSFQYAKEGGMIAQGALSLTHSPLHTDAYYIGLADEFIFLGAEEICLKDMAGIARPAAVGRIVKGIRERHPDILIQYHGHSTPGFSIASALEAARNGADIIDTGMEPLSWGTGHGDLLTIHEMLKDDGFLVKDINTKAYMQARSLSQEFIDEYLGYWIDPKNRYMNSLLIGPGLPGGMMGSLMADLQNNLTSLNKWKAKRNETELTQDELLLKLFDEVKHIWPMLGYPPLVTPFSQYVKNTALMNVLQMEKGKPRWSMLDENTWGMILGESGQLLGPLADEIKDLAASQDRTFYSGNPQELYPDILPKLREEMKQKGWDLGEDEEELLEYALHPREYANYKSGKAKEDFLQSLEEKRKEASGTNSVTDQTAATPPAMVAAPRPTSMYVNVNGESYKVEVSYPEEKANTAKETTNDPSTPEPKADSMASRDGHPVIAPIEGKFYLTKESGERGIKVGDKIKRGDTIGYIEAMKVLNAVAADKDGTVLEIAIKHGQEVEEDDILVLLG